MMVKASTQSGSESHAMFAANKCSRVISKSYSAAKDEGRSSKYLQDRNIITPKVRVVYVNEPKIIKTDPQNFRSVVQRLTGNSTHQSKQKKKQTNHKSPSSEVIAAEVGTEKIEYSFDSNYQLPIMENESTNSSSKDCSALSVGFSDTDITFPNLMNQGLLDEIPQILPSLLNHGFSPADWPGRLLDQKSTLKSKEKKRQTNYQSLSSVVIAAEMGTENLEYTFYRPDEMSITERKTTNFLSEDCSGFFKGFSDMDIIFHSIMNQELLDEIPLVWNNSPFCNMYDQTGV